MLSDPDLQIEAVLLKLFFHGEFLPTSLNSMSNPTIGKHTACALVLTLTENILKRL